jgi:hypothetical protein
MNPADILSAIFNGDADDMLFDINRAAKQRLEKIRADKAEALRESVSIGDRVVLQGVKPLYMNGKAAVVKEINRTRAVVVPEQPTGRFRGDVTVPLSCLSLIEKEVLA